MTSSNCLGLAVFKKFFSGEKGLINQRHNSLAVSVLEVVFGLQITLVGQRFPQEQAGRPHRVMTI